MSPPTRRHGKVCYLEIPTDDVQRSLRFYTAVFRWQVRTRDDGSQAFDDPVGEVSGSWVVGRPPVPNAGLLVYLMVDDAALTVSQIEAHGGRIVQPIGGDAPEITARFLDPYGNLFGIYQEPPQRA